MSAHGLTEASTPQAAHLLGEAQAWNLWRELLFRDKRVTPGKGTSRPCRGSPAPSTHVGRGAALPQAALLLAQPLPLQLDSAPPGGGPSGPTPSPNLWANRPSPSPQPNPHPDPGLTPLPGYASCDFANFSPDHSAWDPRESRREGRTLPVPENHFGKGRHTRLVQPGNSG